MSTSSKMKGFLKKIGKNCRTGCSEPSYAFQQQVQVAGLPIADRLPDPEAPDCQQQQYGDGLFQCVGGRDEKDDELAQLQYVPLPDIDDGTNVIIIEISGKSRQNSVCSSNSSSYSNSSIMGDNMPMIEDSSPSTTFECHTHWKDSFYNLHDYYLDEALCDITVAVGNKNILCHRLVLACCSPYFKAMLTSNMKESRQQCIRIQDIDESALEALIGFMYTSKILLTIDTVQKLLYASSVLQIEVVANACCDFMKNHLHPTNCLGVRAFAELHGRFELMKVADRYTHDHFLEVIEHEEFAAISFSHFAPIIESSDILVKQETQVYEAVIRWVKQDVDNREMYLSKLIAKVRLPMVAANYLTEVVETEDLIRRSLTCRDLVDEAKNYHLSLHKVITHNCIKNVTSSIRARPRKSTSGVLFVVGGRSSSGDPFKSIECYDLRSDKWLRILEMSTKRRHVGVMAIKNKVYAIGGHDGKEHLNTMEVFDSKKNTWTTLAAMKNKRRGVAVAYLGGPLYACGGLDDSMCFQDVERYDPVSDSWSTAAPLNTPRGGVAVACLDGQIYAVGGNDGSTTLNSCERYDPHLNRWTVISPMKTRRAGLGLAAINGYLYVVGGFDDSSPLSTVERYNPATDTWCFMEPMITCRGGVGVSVLCGKIFAVGGHDGSHYLTSAECYDVDNNRWHTVRDMGQCRAGAGVVTVDCHISDLASAANVVSSV
ncbi:LOW QUALITY PROTEIN: uncharacterized protein [Amphiura filiformis]|uniref:LOW QUALITY PROTEIN: uncharacterized protein n=1 Tax=Amphiura filiformis TaxID=82378 RepID=UPI003B217AC2